MINKSFQLVKKALPKKVAIIFNFLVHFVYIIRFRVPLFMLWNLHFGLILLCSQESLTFYHHRKRVFELEKDLNLCVLKRTQMISSFWLRILRVEVIFTEISTRTIRKWIISLQVIVKHFYFCFENSETRSKLTLFSTLDLTSLYITLINAN